MNAPEIAAWAFAEMADLAGHEGYSFELNYGEQNLSITLRKDRHRTRHVFSWFELLEAVDPKDIVVHRVKAMCDMIEAKASPTEPIAN